MTERIWLHRDYNGDWSSIYERRRHPKSTLVSSYGLLGPKTRRIGQLQTFGAIRRTEQYQVIRHVRGVWHVEVAFYKLSAAKAYLRMAIAQEAHHVGNKQ